MDEKISILNQIIENYNSSYGYTLTTINDRDDIYDMKYDVESVMSSLEERGSPWFVRRVVGKIRKGKMIRLYQDITPEQLAEMLCQSIKAVGITEYDRNAKQQLKEITELASWLIFKIRISAEGYEDSREASVIEFRETAKNCYEKLREELND